MATSGSPVSSASAISCGVHLLLLGEPRVLELDVRRVAPEDLHEPIEVGARVFRPTLRERARDAAREAPGERDDPLRVPLEELPVDARLVVVPLEVAERGELDQVRVALVRLREERQVRVPLRLRAPVVGDVHLTADDGLDPGRPGFPVELDSARERAVVRERDRRHLEPSGLLDERRDPARPVEDRVLRVDVQMDEGDRHGKAMLIGPRDVLGCGPLRGRTARQVESTLRRGRGAAAFRVFRATRESALADCLVLRTRPLRVGPELVGERPPDVAKIGPAGDSLELPVDAHEGAEIGLEAFLSSPPRAPGGTRRRGRPRAPPRAGAHGRGARSQMSRVTPCLGYRHPPDAD